jgi:hypothetical protein
VAGDLERKELTFPFESPLVLRHCDEGAIQVASSIELINAGDQNDFDHCLEHDLIVESALWRTAKCSEMYDFA